ncbi:hypothetical protein F2Q70_00003492 [Brassica cretica]|uniref:Uncharacterized protein n=1 Tax=Brassica cretica TaxID=69181 RepID=A0A8S9IT60_BRACR|nr:hypothetical protein F2Q70_00003492 [Brassica cretica]
MHGLMSYRRFGRARLLRSDRAEQTLGRYVATELRLGHRASAWVRSLRSNRALLELVCYISTERNGHLVAT